MTNQVALLKSFIHPLLRYTGGGLGWGAISKVNTIPAKQNQIAFLKSGLFLRSTPTLTLPRITRGGDKKGLLVSDFF
jgi:hypothetical protein